MGGQRGDELNALLPVPNRKRRCLPAPFWCTYAWNRPTSTGAGGSEPASGSAGVGSLARDPLARLRRVKWSQFGTTINFRPAVITIATSQHRPTLAAAAGGADEAGLMVPECTLRQKPGRVR